MPFNLRNRHFLKLEDFTAEEIQFLLDLAMQLKAAKYGGYERRRLEGKNIARAAHSKWPRTTRVPTSPTSDRPGRRSDTRNR
jgi:ornithine carbamoyltransferase